MGRARQPPGSRSAPPRFQGLALAFTVPPRCWRGPPRRCVRVRLRSAVHAPPSPLHAHDLPERVHHLQQAGLRRHHRVDVLAGRRRCVDHVLVRAAFDACGRGAMAGQRQAALGFAAAEGAAGLRANIGQRIVGQIGLPAPPPTLAAPG